LILGVDVLCNFLGEDFGILGHNELGGTQDSSDV
jgi:hypothetical protein